MEPLFYNISFDIWPIGIVFLLILVAIMLLNKKSVYYILLFSVFFIYVLYAIQQVFFPIEINGDYASYMRQEVPFSEAINFVPFYFGPFSSLESSLRTLSLNMLLTVPFGFGISFITHVKAKDILWLAPSTCIGLEFSQLLISLLLRYPYRLIDINDVMMNTVGVFVGYAFFRGFAWVYLWATQQFEIKHDAFGQYIYNLVKLRTA